MRIIDMKVPEDPNYWYLQRKQLVVMTLDLEEMENHPTHKIHRFYQWLKGLLPSLSAHSCIRQATDLRGRIAENLNRLLCTGIRALSLYFSRTKFPGVLE